MGTAQGCWAAARFWRDWWLGPDSAVRGTDCMTACLPDTITSGATCCRRVALPLANRWLTSPALSNDPPSPLPRPLSNAPLCSFNDDQQSCASNQTGARASSSTVALQPFTFYWQAGHLVFVQCALHCCEAAVAAVCGSGCSVPQMPTTCQVTCRARPATPTFRNPPYCLTVEAHTTSSHPLPPPAAGLRLPHPNRALAPRYSCASRCQPAAQSAAGLRRRTFRRSRLSAACCV